MDLAFLLTEGLLGEKVEEFNEQVLDAVGEVTNIVCGNFKDTIDRSEMSIDGITCPSVVMGQSYDFYYAAGFTTVSADFEVKEIPVTKMAARLFSLSVSLMKR
jgi:CheY-specific phosphatase CheX